LKIFDFDAKDVKLRGELTDGASFTLKNLVLRTELLDGLRLPIELRSGTIGRLSITGLDSLASRGGKVVVTVTDITLVFSTASTDVASVEEVVAARRTLLEVPMVEDAAWILSTIGFFPTALSRGSSFVLIVNTGFRVVQ
jgi:hypothetical protein